MCDRCTSIWGAYGRQYIFSNSVLRNRMRRSGCQLAVWSIDKNQTRTVTINVNPDWMRKLGGAFVFSKQSSKVWFQTRAVICNSKSGSRFDSTIQVHIRRACSEVGFWSRFQNVYSKVWFQNSALVCTWISKCALIWKYRFIFDVQARR